jgi:hypothetical protein
LVKPLLFEVIGKLDPEEKVMSDWMKNEDGFFGEDIIMESSNSNKPLGGNPLMTFVLRLVEL